MTVMSGEKEKDLNDCSDSDAINISEHNSMNSISSNSDSETLMAIGQFATHHLLTFSQQESHEVSSI